jgi:hypothetical protein
MTQQHFHIINIYSIAKIDLDMTDVPGDEGGCVSGYFAGLENLKMMMRR